MNRILRKTFYIAASVISAIAILFPVATIAFANQKTDDYGTPEAGITLSGADDSAFKRTAKDSFENYDFSNGLVNFGPSNNWGSWKPTLAEEGITLDDGMIKISHKDGLSENFSKGIESVPVKIPDGAKGKTVYFNLDIATNDGVIVDLFIDRYENADVKQRLFIYDNMVSNGDVSTKKLVNTTATDNTTSVAGINIPQDASTIAFRIFTYTNSEDKVTYIDNIKFITFDDESTTGPFTSLDGIKYSSDGKPLYGTPETGIILAGADDSAFKRPAKDSFENFDFSNGLVNFGPSNNWGSWKPTLAEEGITLDDGMIKISHKDGLSENFSKGIESVPVKIPDGAKGKTIYFNLDIATNDGVIVDLFIDRYENADVKQRLFIYENMVSNGDVSTKKLVNTTATDNTTAVTGIKIPQDASSIAFRIFTYTNSKNKVTYIDNIKFITFDNGTSGAFTDLEGNPYNPSDNPGGNTPGGGEEKPPVPSTNTDYGTKEEGIKLSDSSDNVGLRKPVDYSGNNYDFSDALKYFGPVNLPNDLSQPKYTLAEQGVSFDESKGRIKLSYMSGFGENSWQSYGFESVPVTIPETAYGKTVCLFFKAAIDFDIKLGVKINGNIADTSNGAQMSDLWVRTSDFVVKSNSEKLYGIIPKENWNYYAEFKIPENGGTLAFFVTARNDLIDNSVSNEACAYFDDFDFLVYDESAGTYKDFNRKVCNPFTSVGDDDIRIYGYPETGMPAGNVCVLQPPTSKFLNFDFSDGLKYWGSKRAFYGITDIAEIVSEENNNFIRLKTGFKTINDFETTWAGFASCGFNISADKVKPGDKLTVVYDWNGDGSANVSLGQTGLATEYGRASISTSTVFDCIIENAQLNKDWLCSYAKPTDTVMEDATPNDGFYTFYIWVRYNGSNTLPMDFDNFRIYKCNDKGIPTTYLTGAGNGASLDVTIQDEEEDDGNEYNFIYGKDDDSAKDNSQSNNSSGNNYAQNSAIKKSDLNTIDIVKILEQIEKLKSGEKVDFITLYRYDEKNNGFDVYVPVKALSKKELESFNALTADDLEVILNNLKETLGTFKNTPNMKNAKAYVKLGGNASKTLPLCFSDFKLDFSVNVRIRMGSGSLSSNKTYYAYLCDAKEQEITNLGKIYLEEDGDNLFLTITTKKFSDFLITEDNLKAVKTNNQVEKTNIPLIIGIISTAVVIIAAGTVLLIIFLKRRKIKKQ